MFKLKFANLVTKDSEKHVNPKNQALTPSMIHTLTADGKSLMMHQMDNCVYFPNLGDGVFPPEFERGYDINDAFEQQSRASRKVGKVVNQLNHKRKE